MSTDRPGANELAPSDTRADEPLVARVMGLAGLGATTLGVAAVIANTYSPRWISSSFGYLFAVLGVACLLYHAIRDADIEIRRVYGGLAALLLAGAAVVAVVPGGAVEVKPGSPGVARAAVLGYYLLPWAPVCGLLGLLFGLAFLKNETDEKYRVWGEAGLLGVGVGCVLLAAGIGFYAAFLPPPAATAADLAGLDDAPTTLGPVAPMVVFGLLGLLFLGGYLSNADTAVGIGYWTAVGLGVLGGAMAVTALGRAIFPTVLADGPKALRRLDQSLDYWAAGVRAALVLLGLGGALWAVRAKGLPVWLRGMLSVTALVFATVFVVGSVTNPVAVAPKGTYLVPNGLLLLAFGLTFVAVAVAVCSDHPLVVLTRRELASYFTSPVAYLVLFGMGFVAAFGYLQLLQTVANVRAVSDFLEPILRHYTAFDFIGAIAVAFVVPAITMRAFSEEKRTGTFEMLMTAPVGEATVVVSKFLACLLFYMATWVPAGLFLVGLWVGGGQPFQYKPALGFYLAVLASGCTFVALGLFFSSLTRNQIVAAVLTFAVMLFMLLTLMRQIFEPAVGPEFLSVFRWFDYLGLWRQAINGQLPIPELVAQVSFGAFWLLLTIKVLEARKWS